MNTISFIFFRYLSISGCSLCRERLHSYLVKNATILCQYQENV